MPKVNCLLERCKYCIDTICTAEEITLAEDHYCSGGCDDGWEFEEDDDGLPSAQPDLPDNNVGDTISKQTAKE